MANQDRIERFSKIKTWLGPTFEQRPSPHSILNQMATDEQALILRLTNTGQPWALVSKTLTTVAEQSEYAISQPVSASQNVGKVYYVIRSTGDENLPYVSVPYDDYSELNYGRMPAESDINASFSVPEKISFYRLNAQDQTQYAAIQPTPQDVMTYTIWYLVASIDRSEMAMASVGPVAELSDWLDLQSAAALLADAQWSKDRDINKDERETRGAGIKFQLEKWEPIVSKYIRNINAPKTFDIGYWNDDD